MRTGRACARSPNSAPPRPRGERHRISVLTGNGGLFLPLELARGADGAMTGFAFPEMLVRVCETHADDPGSAEDLFDAYLPLVRYEQQVGIGACRPQGNLPPPRRDCHRRDPAPPGPKLDADDPRRTGPPVAPPGTTAWGAWGGRARHRGEGRVLRS